jgi:pimeloyl-ACP methyl ester carboxylesterase
LLTTRERVSLGGVSTAFLDAGRGEAIVALHGVPTSSALFEPLLPHLRDYRLIAPDLIGQGETDTPAHGPLDYAAYRAHLDAFLGSVPPLEFFLLVHDLGGILGLEWAADHPERVRGIAVLSTTITWSGRVGVLLYGANLLFGRSFVRRVLPAALKRNRTVAPSVVEQWAAPWTRTRIVRGLDLFAPAHLARLRTKLGRIHVPVRLIWGEDDDVFPLSSAHQIGERLTQSALVTIPRCGHWPMLDAPDEVGQHLVDFLKTSAEPR